MVHNTSEIIAVDIASLIYVTLQVQCCVLLYDSEKEKAPEKKMHKPNFAFKYLLLVELSV